MPAAYSERAVTTTVNWTVATMQAQIQTEMLALGMTLRVTSGNRRIYSYVWDATPNIKGTAFLQIDCTDNFNFWMRLGDGLSGNNLTNQSEQSLGMYLINARQAYGFHRFNHPEAKLLAIAANNTLMGVVGILRPSTKPPDYNELIHLYSFIPGDPRMTYILCPIPNWWTDYWGGSCYLFYSNAFGNQDPLGNRHLLKGMVYGAPNSLGIAGIFSEDFGIGACASSSPLDRIIIDTPETQHWRILSNDGCSPIVRVL